MEDNKEKRSETILAEYKEEPSETIEGYKEEQPEITSRHEEEQPEITSRHEEEQPEITSRHRDTGETNVNVNVTVNDKKSNNTVLVAIVAIVAIIVGCIGFKVGPQIVNNINSGVNIFDNISLSNKTDSEKVIAGVTELQSQNPYIQMMIGPEQYIYLLYNKDGEAVAESSNGGMAFYRSDNKIVTLTDTEVIIDTDLSPLAFIKAAVNVADEFGTVESVKSNIEETGKANTLYTITIEGKDNIRKVYEAAGDSKYTDTSMEMMYTGFEDVETSSLRLSVSLGENGEMGAACNVRFGTEEDSEYTSWTFDGYIPTFDWTLDKQWYSNDTSNVQEWIGLANVVVDDISQKMAKFMEENNLATEGTKTGAIVYTEYLEMTDADKEATIKDAITDLGDLGYAVIAEVSDVMKAVGDYYAAGSEENKINVLQAVINVGTEQGWIAENFADGAPENGATDTTGDVSGDITEAPSTDETTEQPAG